MVTIIITDLKDLVGSTVIFACNAQVTLIFQEEALEAWERLGDWPDKYVSVRGLDSCECWGNTVNTILYALQLDPRAIADGCLDDT